MMRILVVNPNTTATMTGKIAHAARKAAFSGTEVNAVNPSRGPESIEGYYDEALAVPGMLEEMRKAPNMDAYVIACFDDTGLDAARCLTSAPVIGIGEAAFHMASLLSHRFGVVTTLSRSIPAIENNLRRYGLAERCAKVRATDVPVLDLERNPDEAHGKIAAEIANSISCDGADAIVLGCAGMADLADVLARHFKLPVLDGVACAIKLAEGLVGIGARTSKLRGYAEPLAKAYR